MGISIEILVIPSKFSELIGVAEKEIQSRLVAGTNAIMDFIEGAQIKRYTATGEPEKPTGSTYERTFTLRDSSRKVIKRRTKRIVIGLWSSDIREAPYNKYVIGPRNEQALVHRDRWKSIEEVVIEADARAPMIVEEKLNEGRI